jgi:DNA-binding protein H-NS
MEDLEQEIGTRAGRAGRVVRARLVKERKALTKRGRKAVRQTKKAAKKAGARAAKAAGAKANKTATKGGKRRGVKVAIKYRGPNSGETWTGRGKLPRWLSAYIAQGKTKAEFLIK